VTRTTAQAGGNFSGHTYRGGKILIKILLKMGGIFLNGTERQNACSLELSL